MYEALHKAGAQYGMVNAGYRAIDSLSIEKGYPHWHQEVRIGQMVSLDIPALLFRSEWMTPQWRPA